MRKSKPSADLSGVAQHILFCTDSSSFVDFLSKFASSLSLCLICPDSDIDYWTGCSA